MQDVIKIRNITKKFKNKEILKQVDLDVKDGEIIGIIGRNGSGKTVLLKIIAGLYFPTSGNIEYIKYNVSDDYGILIDNGFIENETGFNNLKMISLLKKVVNDEDIYDTMKYVGLNPFDKTKYRNYSTGMKQKLRIAETIMENPHVLILDEPFNGLDIHSVEHIREKLLELNSQGVTIIITSHYQEDIEHLCHKVYEMKDGELLNYEKV